MRHFLFVTLWSAAVCLSPVICHAAESQQDDPYANTSVLVEAFVVEVQNAALAEAGVNPIGQAPERITPLKILWCLKDEDKARVVSGAKVAARHSGIAESKTANTIYVGREVESTHQKDGQPMTVSNVRYDSYKDGINFEVRPSVINDRHVYCFYEYGEVVFQKTTSRQGPPNQTTYNWKGNLTAPSGQPVIAAAVQGESTTTFLVLTATIQAVEND
jgi:hypothetical protein